jgi:hypothetical protein
MILTLIWILLSGITFTVQVDDECPIGLEKFVPGRNQEFLRLASYNAKYLDLDDETAATIDSMYYDLMAMKANILILQQIPTTAVAPRRNVMDFLLQEIGYQYYCESVAAGNGYGVLVASTEPFVSCNSIDLGLGRELVNVDIAYEGSRLDIIGSHVTSLNDTARKAHIDAISHYIQGTGIIEDHLVMGIDTDSNTSGILWNLRGVLPVEDIYRILSWTRPNYANFTGTKIDYMLISNSLNDYLVGSYVWDSVCQAHIAVIGDLFKKYL